MNPAKSSNPKATGRALTRIMDQPLPLIEPCFPESSADYALGSLAARPESRCASPRSLAALVIKHAVAVTVGANLPPTAADLPLVQ